MRKYMKNILIVGGGIAGLSAGLLLQDHYKVTIIDKKSSFSALSTGLYIPSNGVNILKKMGLEEELRNSGFSIFKRNIFNSKGKELLNLDLEDVWNLNLPCIGIKRADLHSILVNKIDKNKVDIHFDTTVEKRKTKGSQTEVILSNGMNNTYDLIIGADGLNSEIRTSIFNDSQIRVVTPNVCRFIIERPVEVNSWTLYIGKKGQFLIVPISDETAYCYVNRNDDVDNEHYMDAFKLFPKVVQNIIENWDDKDCHWDDVKELGELNSLGHDNTVLIGDAAHAMPPFMAQGSSLALEDSWCLTNWLIANDDWAGVSSEFTKIRKERIDWTRDRNQRREKLSKMPFWIAQLGMRFVGEKNWKEDYSLLSKMESF